MMLRTLALALAATAAVAQHAELKGRVADARSNTPVAGAKVTFSAVSVPASPLPGVRSDYRSTQRLLLARSRLPSTVTDRDGEWRILLSPRLAALTTSGLSRLMMTIESPKHTTWQRCFDGDLRDAAAASPALLEAKPETPPLIVELLGPGRDARPPRGCVAIERSFRIQRNRTVWVRDVLPIESDGRCRFDRPVRIPGEPAATSPTARAEAYRVHVLAIGCEPVIRMLPPGQHRIRLDASPWRPRKILAARAQPATAPIRARYPVEGAQDGVVEIEFEDSAIPLLGDIEPDSITTGSGPVEVDAWDPDVPLFVVAAAANDASGEDSDAAAAADDEPELGGTLQVQVQDSAGAPVFGAGIWLERRALRRASTRSELFDVTNARGVATLERLPRGSFSVLALHPEAGFAEALVDVTPPGTNATATVVRLGPLPPRAGVDAAGTQAGGTILLDLGSAAANDDGAIAVGIFAGTKVVLRRFESHPGKVRLEGLPLAPTGYFVRPAEQPPRFVAGAIPGSATDPAQTVLDVAASDFRLRAMGPDGKSIRIQALSLGDPPRRDKLPRTSELFTLEHDGDVTKTTVHARGGLWLRAWAEGMQGADVLLDPSNAATDIPMTFEAIPPKPEAGEDGAQPNKKDGCD